MSTIKTEQGPPTAILISVGTDSESNSLCMKDSVAELQELARTAEVSVQGIVLQYRQPDPRSYLGKGKLEELKADIKSRPKPIQVLITDDELSPAQQRYLEQYFSLKIIDRTRLVLDIFAQRAQSHEAQIQVELAQLNYLRPRLTRLWPHLSRLGGGIGTRGPGETQLEVDRRRIQTRITHLKKSLKKISQHRERYREKRKKVPILTAALIGYTNSGKSTLLNTLTKSKVLSQDLLFATLDPSTRRLSLPDHEDILLTDTVGFIQKLPHQLVDAFRATLEETMQAHFLIHVVDASHPQFLEHIDVSDQVLGDLENRSQSRIFLFNKADLIPDIDRFNEKIEPLFAEGGIYEGMHYAVISAKNGWGLSEFYAACSKVLSPDMLEFSIAVPYPKMEIHHLLHQKAKVIDERFEEDAVHMKVKIHRVLRDRILAQLYPDQ